MWQHLKREWDGARRISEWINENAHFSLNLSFLTQTHTNLHLWRWCRRCWCACIEWHRPSSAQHITAYHLVLLLSDFTSNPLQAKRNSNMHISFLHICSCSFVFFFFFFHFTLLKRSLRVLFFYSIVVVGAFIHVRRTLHRFANKMRCLMHQRYWAPWRKIFLYFRCTFTLFVPLVYAHIPFHHCRMKLIRTQCILQFYYLFFSRILMRFSSAPNRSMCYSRIIIIMKIFHLLFGFVFHWMLLLLLHRCLCFNFEYLHFECHSYIWSDEKNCSSSSISWELSGTTRNGSVVLQVLNAHTCKMCIWWINIGPLNTKNMVLFITLLAGASLVHRLYAHIFSKDANFLSTARIYPTVFHFLSITSIGTHTIHSAHCTRLHSAYMRCWARIDFVLYFDYRNRRLRRR